MANETIDNVIKGMMPNIKTQQEGIYNYIQQLNRRLGVGGGSRLAAQAVAPYAEQASQKAGDLALAASREDEQKRQFEENLAQRKTEFANYQQQQKLANMIEQFKTTGVWTPEMLEAFGYDISKGQQRDIQDQLNILGVGQEGAASGPFGSQNQMLFNRALQPSPTFGGKAGQRQDAWLRSQFS